jgi:hypothetical protein
MCQNHKRGYSTFPNKYNVPFSLPFPFLFPSFSLLHLTNRRVSSSSEAAAAGSDSVGRDDVCERYETIPDNFLVDAGCSTNDDITIVEEAGSKVVVPMTHEDRILKRGGDPHDRRQGDSDEMAAFRDRMRTDEAKVVLNQRPSIAECCNRVLPQYRVRGLEQVRTTTSAL